ncbi:hypothetical protein [Thiomonas delicata]|uniref:hypothetical protein n=1 Tax=Thiomonas delicata TaxID=364030 RepID=UPI001C946F32|nr:hypothetical protein [Thiomonas delicata]
MDTLGAAIETIGKAEKRTRTPRSPEITKPAEAGFVIDSLAERVGFEPTVRKNRTPDFESAFNAFYNNRLSNSKGFLVQFWCSAGRIAAWP